jgi:hypothetical protein
MVSTSKSTSTALKATPSDSVPPVPEIFAPTSMSLRGRKSA